MLVNTNAQTVYNGSNRIMETYRHPNRTLSLIGPEWERVNAMISPLSSYKKTIFLNTHRETLKREESINLLCLR